MDTIYFLVIHLEKHVYRKELFIKRMKHFSCDQFQFEFVEAIEHDIGREGCRLSHIKCIQMAKERNWKYCWVLEDDILFLNPSKLFAYFKKNFCFHGQGDIGNIHQLEFYNDQTTKSEKWRNTIYQEFIKVIQLVSEGQIDVFNGGSSSFGDNLVFPKLFHVDMEAEDIPCSPESYQGSLKGTQKPLLFHLEWDEEFHGWEGEFKEGTKLSLTDENYKKYSYVQSHFTASHCVCYGQNAYDVVLNSFQYYHIDQFITHCGSPKGIYYLKQWRNSHEAIELKSKCDYNPPLLNICTIFPFLAIAYSTVSSIREEELDIDEEVGYFFDTEREIHYLVAPELKDLT